VTVADATFAAGRIVVWTIVPTASSSATIDRYCPGCAARRPFASSGRFRLNAQRRRIDVWLVYRCARCDRTWNRPVHQRATPSEIGAVRLVRLQANDPELAEEMVRASDGATNEASFRIDGPRLDLASDAEVEARLALAAPCRIRLDAALALALGVNRSDVARLARSGRIASHHGDLRLGRRVRHGDVVRIAPGVLSSGRAPRPGPGGGAPAPVARAPS
jgi:hypothetical protein